MAEILLFNIEKSKAIKIKMLCRKFFMEAKEVSKEDFGCTISYLLGMSDDRGGAEHADFSEEMLYFAGFDRGIFGIFLDQLKRQRARNLCRTRSDGTRHVRTLMDALFS